MNRLAGAGLLTLALLLSACGASAGDDTAADPGGTGGPARPEVAHGPDDVILRIETGGGFVPVDYAFATRPTVLVTGDGVVLQPAPRAADSPPPRLLSFVRHTVDDATLQDLVGRADEAGLLAEPPDYFQDGPQVTDMPSTTVEITADGETWTHSAYALGFGNEQGQRAALAEFVDEAIDLLDDGDAEPYEPEAVRLAVTDLTRTAPSTSTVAWPDAVDLGDVGECTVVEEPAAVAAVTDALGGVAQDTLFSQGDRTWSVSGAVVLPGETRPCADW